MGISIESGLVQSSMSFFTALSRSANQADFCKRILTTLRSVFGYRHSAFIFLDTESFEAGYPVSNNIPDSSLEKYHAWYREEAIFLKAITRDRRLLARKVLSVGDVISERDFERSVYYRDILRPAESRDVLVLPIAGRERIGGGLAVFKPAAEGRFSDDERKLFSMLNDPISTLLVNNLETRRLLDEIAATDKTMEGLAAGVIVLEQDGSVHRVNRAARDICGTLYAGAGEVPVQSLLDALGERATPGKARAQTLSGFDGSKVKVRIVPDSYVTPLQSIAARTTIYLETGDGEGAKLELLAGRHGLSRREAEIVAQVVRGKDNTAIAEALFVSPNTVRTHLQNIYQKLSVNSRISVIQTYMNLAP